MSTSSGSIKRQQILNVPQDILVGGNSVWHTGNFAKSEFTPASHMGTGGTSHAAVTQSVNGFMIASDKTKLDGVSTGANKVTSSVTNGSIKIDGTDTVVYTHPSGDGNLHIPVTGTTNNNKVLKAGSTAGSVSWGWIALSEATGTISDTQHGTRGGDTLHAAVTQSVNGFMIAADKVKLDNIQANAINQTTADGRYLQLIGGTLSDSLVVNNIGDAKLTLNADTDNDAAEGGEAKLILTQDSGIVGVEIKTTQGGTADNALTIAPFMDYNTATPTKNYSVFIHDKKIWHEGSFAKSEFTPASHIGTGGTSHAAVTTSVNGFMSASDKSKLDGISASAKNVAASSTNGNIKIDNAETIVYTHPTTSGNVHLPAGGAAGQWVKWSAAGTGAWTGIDWSDVASKPTSVVSDIDDAVTKRHSQNTDTGTVSQTFSIGTGTDASATTLGLLFGNNVLNPYIRWSSTNFQFYKDWNSGTNDVWADIQANTFKNSSGTEVSYVGHTHLWADLTDKPATFTPPTASATVLGGIKIGTNLSIDVNGVLSGAYAVATTSADGLFSSGDKTKLDGIATSANNYTHPAYATKSISLDTTTAQVIDTLTVTSDATGHLTAASVTTRNLTLADIGYTGAANANYYTHPNHTGDVTSVADGATTISNNVVTNTKLADMAVNTIKGRATTGTGDPEDLAPAQVRAMINVADGANNYTHPSGDGNLHVPATSTANNGKFLKAGSTAGSLSWGGVAFTDVTGTITATQHAVQTDGTLHAAVTTSTNGFMTAADKVRLDAITDDANHVADSTTNGNILIDGTEVNIYTHPSGDGNLHVPATSTTSNGMFLKSGATAGSLTWNQVNFTDIAGTVTDTQHGNRGGGSLHAIATQSVNGFLSSTDKTKLDGISASAKNVALSSTNGNIKIDNVETVVYTHPSGDGNLHVPATSTTNSGKFLKAGATAGSITWTGVAFTDISGTITATQHAAQTDATLHAVATQSANGFLSSPDKTKLDGIQSSAINQTTADGRYLQLTGGSLSGNLSVTGAISTTSTLSFGVNGIRAGGTSNTALVLYANGGNVFLRPNGDTDSSTEFVVSPSGLTWANNTVWHAGNFTPANKSDVGHTHTVANITDLTTNYYDKTSINTQMAAKGDIKSNTTNTFSDTNTFTKAGVALKIQPSTAVVGDTVLLQVNNSAGNSLVTMGTSTSGETTGKVVINGDLQVTGTTTQSATQDILGDMNVTGNLNVTGNAVLGDSTADQTTIKGDLRLEGNFLPINRYLEIGRFPIFGIADDFQFETDSISFQDIISHVSTFDVNGNGVFDTPNTGATRYYRLMITYASSGTDDSILHIVQEGTSTEVISFALPAVNLPLDANSGLGSKARTWKSAPFTTSYIGNTTFQGKKNVSGNLAIRYIEVIAYDYYA